MTTMASKSARSPGRPAAGGGHVMRPLSALALALSLAWGQAHALSLGRLSVQSALGEPLRAEIAIPDITPDEAASLKATLASPEAFKAAGVEYNPGLANVRVVYEQRGEGRAALVLTTNRPLNEPFLDLILEANWANGKISRDYTLLLDPPVLKAAVPASQPAPVTEAVVPPVRDATAAPPATARAPAPQPVQPRPGRAPAPPAVAPAPAAIAAPNVGNGTDQQVVVKPGDTAGRIAAASKPTGISLDQMLVALLGANPQAFIERNVNRLRAGAVLTLPTAEQASATPPQQARQAIVAQSRDFNAFRAKLAANVPAVPVTGSSRQSTGKLDARVEDKQASATTPDKLQLSKGSVAAGGKSTPEDALAKNLESQAAAARTAELNKNLEDLAKATGKTVPAGTTAAPAAAPGSAASASGVPIAATAPASTPASTPSQPAASAPETGEASKPVPVAAAPVKAPKPAAVESEDFLANYGFLLGLGALLALLGALALFRSRQRRRESRPSAFMDSLVQVDPMYGSSGGQRIDTREKDSGASSMGFSPSQLDAAADVDPVVEAEVYLAYGRDVQAEEILKEAMRTYPTRVSIHVKLAEIYAKRRDTKSFEAASSQVAALTQSAGPDWAHVQALHQQLDPSVAALPTDLAPSPAPVPVASPSPAPTPPAEPPVPAPVPTAAVAIAPSAAANDLPPLDLDLAFPPPAKPAPTAAPAEADRMASITAAAPAPLDMLDFKLDQLDVVSTPESTPLKSGVSAERLEVKLELASEFMAIGDDEGARALVQEVLAEATGDLKARAQKLLSSLR